MMRALVVASLLLMLAGCASSPVTAPPQVVTVTTVRYAPLPAADLLPCLAPAAPILTGADVIAAWQRALAALSICNEQITNLRAISAKAKP